MLTLHLRTSRHASASMQGVVRGGIEPPIFRFQAGGLTRSVAELKHTVIPPPRVGRARPQNTACSYAEREALRIELSRALGTICQARAGITAHADDRPAASVVDQLGKLAVMLESGLLTREEFDRMKAAVIAKA